MVSNTFENLDNDKKARIIDALLNEFSNHTLNSAQVSRIVKESDIARGAFYKYFDDLKDAYSYLYGIAMREIHQNITTERTESPSAYVQQTREFVEKSKDSRFYTLVKMHILHNESDFVSTFDDHLITESEYYWATQVMIHETIKQIMLEPSAKEILLKKLANVLDTLAKEEK